MSVAVKVVVDHFTGSMFYLYLELEHRVTVGENSTAVPESAQAEVCVHVCVCEIEDPADLLNALVSTAQGSAGDRGLDTHTAQRIHTHSHTQPPS